MTKGIDINAINLKLQVEISEGYLEIHVWNSKVWAEDIKLMVVEIGKYLRLYD